MRSKIPTLFALAALLASGCESTCPPENGGRGRIVVQLGASDITAEVSRGSLGLTALPAAGDFSLTVQNATGIVYECAKMADYDPQTSYAVGNYTALASWGDVTVEAFETPAFTGSKEFAVTENQTTQVVIEAGIANAVVAMEYTDSFKEYFTDYTFTLQSGFGTAFTFTKEETRRAFINPAAPFSVSGSATRYDGKQVTIPSTAFPAIAARTLYRVKYDVNEGQTGKKVLVVNFDDQPIATETLEFELNPDAPAQQ